MACLLPALLSLAQFFFETSNGRLPLKDGSDWREAFGKHVSDDLEHVIFRRRKQFFLQTFLFLARQTVVLEELQGLGHHWQIPHKKLSPAVHVF